jgi:glycosyltransferase involved in cell wall biosynthesis
LKSPFFSVIIPTFNQAEFLNKAIKSVLEQTYKDYELIIIDNFSTDNTEEIIKNFNNKKIQYYKNSNNGIIAKSRNIGINKSKGKWLAFLDSDDFWYTNRLKIAFDEISKNEHYEFISTNEVINDKIHNTKKIWKYGPSEKNFYKRLLKYGSCISTSASIVKRIFYYLIIYFLMRIKILLQQRIMIFL